MIPKNLVNFFMYIFMLIQNQMCDKTTNSYFQYNKLTFMREGLETITKNLYPKVYEFYPEITPLKFKPKSLTHDTIRIVDNGKTITLVVGD